MVSFSCEVCNDTVIKKKLDQHRQWCHGAYFTCIDCSTTFSGTDYKAHTQCISEAEKYEKGLYKGKPSKANKPAPKEVKESPKVTAKTASPTSEKTEKTEKDKKEAKKSDGKVKKDKKSKKTSVDLSKYAGESLSKVLKSISKDTKLDKKDLLKKLRLELVHGEPVLKL